MTRLLASWAWMSLPANHDQPRLIVPATRDFSEVAGGGLLRHLDEPEASG